MLQLALTLSALALWDADSGGARGSGPTGWIAVAMAIPASWLVLRELSSTAPALTALASVGLGLSMFRLMRMMSMLPPLSRRRRVLLLPLVGFWIFSLLAPSRFVPKDSSLSGAVEEE
jgi:hypothetical protein